MEEETLEAAPDDVTEEGDFVRSGMIKMQYWTHFVKDSASEDSDEASDDEDDETEPQQDVRPPTQTKAATARSSPQQAIPLSTNGETDIPLTDTTW
jgi:hypothetical protein